MYHSFLVEKIIFIEFGRKKTRNHLFLPIVRFCRERAWFKILDVVLIDYRDCIFHFPQISSLLFFENQIQSYNFFFLTRHFFLCDDLDELQIVFNAMLGHWYKATKVNWVLLRETRLLVIEIYHRYSACDDIRCTLIYRMEWNRPLPKMKKTYCWVRWMIFTDFLLFPI